MNDFAGLPRPTSVNWQGGGSYGMVNFGDDNQLVVLFYKKSVKNAARSMTEGRPIFEDIDHIRMHPPGERLNIIDRPVQEADKQRFANKWYQYLNNQQQVPEGTPIDLLFPNHPSVADSLRAQGVHTVEQCASLSANAIDTIGIGAVDYVNKAKQYLEKASQGADFHKLRKELDDQKSENRVLNQKLSMVLAQLKAIEQRTNNPMMASNSPPFVPGYDVQSERINANHKTRELAEANKRANSDKKDEEEF